ncbi:microtubule-associated protein RP/EB family member 1-like [Drosophila subobscura]|uniref:microtubule-associated protein RP/EB family member 1-like n=1 Tax=Drosophila subobscura TaxID=7241 RepID=UPI00155AA6B1|nr:microtubule-associated protein RP/EB family member 1-like [Drosophila subobscura]
MQNVYHTRNSQPSQNLSRKELIKWVNETLNIEIKQLEALGSGAEYCQLFNQLRPGIINLKKVKYGSRLQSDYQSNLILLQHALQKVGVEKDIQIGRMSVGGRRENLDFAQWFKKLYDRNIQLQDAVFENVSEPSKKSSSSTIVPSPIHNQRWALSSSIRSQSSVVPSTIHNRKSMFLLPRNHQRSFVCVCGFDN